MPLEDFLFPNEVIKDKSTENITYGGQSYELYVTDKRLIFYSRTGSIFKRDNIISEKLLEIQTISFKEEGLFFKKGTINIETKDKKLLFEGSAENMKALYLELQKMIQTIGIQTLIQQTKETKEKETVVKEVILIPCQYCGGLLPQTSVFCPNCGARRK